MKVELIKSINENKNSLEIRALIINFKRKGGTQKEAHEILENIRDEVGEDESKDDKISELLDFVCGWCQEQFRIWEEVKIFYSEQDEQTKRYIVIEEDESSIWAYLTIPNELKIEKDCFLASRYEIVETEFSVKDKNREGPPSMIKDFATEKSFIKGICEEDISINWLKNGNALLCLKEKPLLFFHSEYERGFSKSIAKDGMYGNTWKEDKFKEILK